MKKLRGNKSSKKRQSSVKDALLLGEDLTPASPSKIRHRLPKDPLLTLPYRISPSDYDYVYDDPRLSRRSHQVVGGGVVRVNANGIDRSGGAGYDGSSYGSLSGYGHSGGGGGVECCPLVVDPLTMVTLLAFIAGATLFLNIQITMILGGKKRRRRRSNLSSGESSDAIMETINQGLFSHIHHDFRV